MLAEEEDGLWPPQGTLTQNQVRSDARGENKEENKEKKRNITPPLTALAGREASRSLHQALPIALYADKNILS